VTAIFFPPGVAPGATFTLTTGATATVYATPTGYSRTSGSFISDGFFVGQPLTVSGFTQAANNGASQITGISEAATGSASLSATASGYARTAASGSFVTNGFQVGQTVTAVGFTNPLNNGRSVITAVTATALTVTKAGGTAAEAAATGRTITADPRITVTKTGGTVLEAGSTGPTTVLSATATGYDRSAGDFVAEGFVVGQTITASGFAKTVNNGNSTITAVTPTSLTVTKTTGTAVEAGTTGPQTMSVAPSGANTVYTRAAGDFIADGFVVGHSVRATGFQDSANNGVGTVTAVTATTLTVSKTPQGVAEAAGAGKAIAGFDVRTIANGGNRTIAGQGGRRMSFTFEARPPRPPGT